MKHLHWVANPSTSPECGCGWFETPPYEDDCLVAVERHVREENANDLCICPGPTMTDTSCPVHGDFG